MADGDLVQRFEAWVEGVVRAGRCWIVVNDSGQNTVLEDPHRSRDLQLLFVSEEDARASEDASRGLQPDPLEADGLIAICEAAEARGEAFALWSGGSWVVAEPDLLREELEQYAE